MFRHPSPPSASSPHPRSRPVREARPDPAHRPRRCGVGRRGGCRGRDPYRGQRQRGGCSPTTVSATAGRVVFEVTNAGPELGEFEVLSGTTVVDEVENIVPGFVVNLDVPPRWRELRAHLLRDALAARPPSR